MDTNSSPLRIPIEPLIKPFPDHGSIGKKHRSAKFCSFLSRARDPFPDRHIASLGQIRIYCHFKKCQKNNF